MAVGIGAAYSSLEAPKDNLSQNAQFLGNIFAQQGEEFRNRAEREKVRKDKEISDWEAENKINYKELQQKVTGFEKFDDVGRDYVQKVTDKYIQYHDEALKALKSGNFTKKREYENKMLKLRSSLSSVKDMQEAWAKRFQENLQLEQDGKISGVDKDTWLAQNYAIQGADFVVDLDDNDNPIVHGISTIDVPSSISPAGKVQAPFSIPMRNMMNGEWRPYERTELTGNKGLIETVTNTIGERQRTIQKDLKVIKEQYWNDEMTQNTKTLIAPLLASDEVMADLTNQFDNSSKKRSGFSSEEREVMADKLTELVKGNYKIKYEEEFNKDKANYLNQQQRLKLDRDKLNADIKDDREKNKIAWAKVGLDRDEFNFKKTQATKNTGVEVGEGVPYTRDIGYGAGQQTFIPYTLRNKSGKLQNIVIGKKILENGKEEDITVPSVSMERNGQMIIFTDANGNEQKITRRSSPQAFSLIEAQISGNSEDVNNDPLGLGL